MGRALKNSERIRPVVNRQDLKSYVKLEAQTDSRLAPFHRNWTYRDFVQILQAEGIMAQSYVSVTKDILHKDEVVGFVLYRMHEDRFEILNLVAEPDRPDVVGKLLAFMQEKTMRPNTNRWCVNFTVRETDEVWHSALKAAGFYAELVHECFDQPVEDGYKFRWDSSYTAEED